MYQKEKNKMVDHLNEISTCCNAKIVGILIHYKGNEEKMCTGCGKILGIKEERLPYSKYITQTERRRGKELFDSLFQNDEK